MILKEQIFYNEFNWNGVKTYQKTIINEHGCTINQSYSPFDSTGKPDFSRNDDEVTHEKFFGENIARIIKALKS